MLIGHTTRGLTLRHPIHIEDDARARHLYIVGATGTGKTGLLKNLIAHDAREGNGFAFIDPHGDAADEVISLIPRHRADHLCYLNLADTNPIGLNFMTGIPLSLRPLAAANIVSAFIHIFNDEAIGNRSQQVLRHSVRLLMDTNGGTLLSVIRLLRDEKYRTRVITTATDPLNRAYWDHEFRAYTPTKRDEVVSPILNKLDAFLAFPAVRNILAQTTNSIDLRRIMDEKRILIVNLNKGQIGKPALLIGALIFSAITQAAMARSDIEEAKRVPFYLHADEVQNYSNAAIEDVLSELRKYKLFLTAAHQYMFQLDRSIQEAILANAATLISFRVGATDAPVLSKHFGVQNNQLQDLHNFQAYVRPLEDGQPVDPVLLDLLPPPLPLHNEPARLVRNSSVRFGRNKAEVEAKIASFVSSIGARLPRQAANKSAAAPKIRTKKKPPAA